jgi:DNA-binding XRE family transcriptional regulator
MRPRRGRKGERNRAGHKLTTEQVRQIRQLYALKEDRQEDLAYRFGVSQMTISRIIRGKAWRLVRAGWVSPYKSMAYPRRLRNWQFVIVDRCQVNRGDSPAGGGEGTTEGTLQGSGSGLGSAEIDF